MTTMPSPVRSLVLVCWAPLVGASGCGLVGLDGWDGAGSSVSAAGASSDGDGDQGWGVGGADARPGESGGTGSIGNTSSTDGGEAPGGSTLADGGGSSGGASSGGASSGGASSGGASSGGVDATGGSTSTDGGASSGDNGATGGASSSGGVTATGGSPSTGGSDAGGGSDGTASTGGAGNSAPVWDGSLVPCGTACLAPLLLYRPLENAPLAGVKADPGASVEVSSAFVHSGASALATTQGAPGTDAQISETIAGVASGDLYYRAWLYVPTGAITDWLKVLGLNNASADGIAINLLAGGEVEIYSKNTLQRAQSASSLVPGGEWFCLGVHTVVANTASGSIEVALNDQPVVSLTQLNTRPGLSIDSIVYGIAETGPLQTGATIYTDDIVVSTQPVSCDPL